MTRARDLARIANSNALTIDSSGNVGIGSTVPTSKLSVVGIVSATSFSGNVTGTATGLSGSPNITVTGVNASGIVTATSFSGSGANLTGISSVSFATTSFGLSGSPNITVGVITATTLKVGTGVTINAGIISASDFIDDGTNLLTAINTKASTGKAIATAMVFG